MSLPSVPDLDLPVVARKVREPFEDDDVQPAHLELDLERNSVAVPELAPCMECGAPLEPHAPACRYCASSHAPRAPIPAFAPPPLAPSTFAPAPPAEPERFASTIASIPFGFWKRLAFYPLLAMALGNGCTCRGLSLGTNIALALLVSMGIAGVIMCLRNSSPST
jgi:hypothetical protein